MVCTCDTPEMGPLIPVGEVGELPTGRAGYLHRDCARRGRARLGQHLERVGGARLGGDRGAGDLVDGQRGCVALAPGNSQAHALARRQVDGRRRHLDRKRLDDQVQAPGITLADQDVLRAVEAEPLGVDEPSGDVPGGIEKMRLCTSFGGLRPRIERSV